MVGGEEQLPESGLFWLHRWHAEAASGRGEYPVNNALSPAGGNKIAEIHIALSQSSDNGNNNCFYVDRGAPPTRGAPGRGAPGMRGAVSTRGVASRGVASRGAPNPRGGPMGRGLATRAPAPRVQQEDDGYGYVGFVFTSRDKPLVSI